MIRKYQIAPVALAAMVVAASVGTARDARAVQPSGLPQGLELAGSAIVPRPIRTTSVQPPRAGARAWQRFRSDVGGSWLAIWDESTHVPLRVFGQGMAAPGVMADATVAQKHAEDVLTRHIALFAPGARASDFVLALNEVHDGMRVVSFLQTFDGLRVLDAQLSFRYKNDRLILIASEAAPSVKSKIAPTVVSEAAAEKRARTWIEGDYGAASVVTGLEGPFILPIITPGAVAGYSTVVRITLDTFAPRGRWAVYLDAAAGEPVARKQTLHFATGELQINAPVRQPLDQRANFPAQFATVSVDTVGGITDGLGQFTFADGAPVDGTVQLNGTFVRVLNEAGQEATQTFSFAPDAAVVWDASDNEYVDAQLTTFVHTKLAKDYAKSFAPDFGWLDDRLTASVNLDDTCNAYFDGSTINFFRESAMCANTGRIADVVYHEFGHGVHFRSSLLGAGALNSDAAGALSEGVSDYLAATITGDPAMGRGFFKSQQPLRDIDPMGGEYIWPDSLTGEVHQDGLIIAGALWDLRKLLVAKHGEEQGVAIADELYFRALRTSADMPSMYPEMLAVDDDDGDLSNGTPNVCEIIEAFGAHGLRPLDVVSSTLSVEPPQQDGFAVSIAVTGLYEQCNSDTVQSATVVWGLQRQATQQNTIPMTGEGASYTASIPPQMEGEVVNYRVEVVLGSGQTIAYPDNPADPMYQFFVGDVIPLYCTDFETDPNLEGWTHGLLNGDVTEGADDWQWGPPLGTATNGDPSAAFSGTSVFGNDLGGGNFNGLYQANKRNYADSPVIDASGYENVRIQYRRWLAVEDGAFDKATVWTNNQIAWRNFASPNQDQADVHHQDREWRFHDIDVTKLRREDGSIQVRYEIESDPGLQMGGWTLDDFCVVAYEGSLPGATCGDGKLDAGEACDDGNIVIGDGCDAFCAIEEVNEEVPDGATDPLVVTNGCACTLPAGHDDGRGLAVLALGLGLAALRRRRS